MAAFFKPPKIGLPAPAYAGMQTVKLPMAQQPGFFPGGGGAGPQYKAQFAASPPPPQSPAALRPPSQGYAPQQPPPPADIGQGGDGQMNVRTSMQYMEPYSQQSTDQALAKGLNNLAKKTHQWEMKGSGQMGNNASYAAQAAGREAESASQAALLNATLPFQDEFERSSAMHRFTRDRDAEANQLAQIGLAGQNNAFNAQQSNQAAMVRALFGQI
jgi:hypothetical protein